MAFWRIGRQYRRDLLRNPQDFVTHDIKFSKVLQLSEVKSIQIRYQGYDKSSLPRDAVEALTEDEAVLRVNDPLFHTGACTTDFVPRIMATVLRSPKGLSPGVGPDLRTAGEVIARVLRLQEAHLRKKLSPDLTDTASSPIRKSAQAACMDGDVVRITSFVAWLADCLALHPLCLAFNNREETRQQRAQRKARQASSTNPAFDMKLVWSANKVVINLGTSKWTLPYECLRELHGKMSDLLSVMMYTRVAAGNYLPDDAPGILTRGVLLLCDFHAGSPTTFFQTVKTLEALGIGHILSTEEKWTVPNTEFLTATVEGFPIGTPDRCFVEQWLELLSATTLPMRSELSCLSKITGHPFVDTRGGTEKLKTRTRKEVTFDAGTREKLQDLAKFQFCKAYYARHKKWPNIPRKDVLPIHMQEMIVSRKSPNDPYIAVRYGTTLQASDYRNLELGQEATFDAQENPIPLLKDRSISPALSDLLQVHILPILAKALQIPGPVGLTRAEQFKKTSLLCAFITTSMQDLRYAEFLEAYRAEDRFEREIVLSHLLLKLVSKEGELKGPDPRQFAAGTIPDRHRRQITEAAVAGFLGEYSHEHTMTSSDIQLLRQLAALRKWGDSHPNSRTLVISIDVSAWNNGFRSELVDGVMQATLARYYDEEILKAVHAPYEYTHFYSLVGREFVNYWHGQGGGIEGLSQDTWVWVYLVMCHEIFSQWQYLYTFLCHGDDFRAYISIPEATARQYGMDHIRRQIILAVKEGLAKYNLAVKEYDSFGSSTFGTYKKIMSVDSIILPTTFRKIMKAHSTMDVVIPSLDSFVGTTFSSAHGACATAPSVVPAYTCALFWSLYHLLPHAQYRGLTPAQAAALMMVPASLGGFPILSPLNLAIRASADMVADFVDLLQTARMEDPELAGILEGFLYQPMTGSATDAEVARKRIQLLKDPYAFPIAMPTMPLTMLRREMLPFLTRIAKNELVREIMDISSDAEVDQLVADLGRSPVWSASLVSEIYGQSPLAMLTDFLTKFESGRSILNFFLAASAKKGTVQRIFRKALLQEEKLQAWRFELVSGLHGTDDILRQEVLNTPPEYHPRDGPPTRCPVAVREQIADYVWRIRVETATTCPPHHLITVRSASHALSLPPPHLHFLAVAESLDPYPGLDQEIYKRGPTDPFLAGVTSSARQPGRIKYPVQDPIVRMLADLTAYRSWAMTPLPDLLTGIEVIDDLSKVCEYLMKMVAPDQVVATMIQAGPKRLRGCRLHHIHSRAGQSAIVLNHSCAGHSRVSVNTDTNMVYARSASRHNVNFLHVITHIRTMLVLPPAWSIGSAIPDGDYYAGTDPCTHCHAAHVEHSMVFPTAHYVQPPRLRIAHLKVAETALSRIIHAVEVFGRDHDRVDPDINAEDPILVDRAMQIKAQDFGRLQTGFYHEMRELFGQHGVFFTDSDVQRLEPLSLSSKPDLSQRDLRKIPFPYLLEVVVGMAARVFVWGSDTRQDLSSWFEDAAPGMAPSGLPWYPMMCYIHEAGFLAGFMSSVYTVTGESLQKGASRSPAVATRSLLQLAPSMIIASKAPPVHIAIASDVTVDRLECEVVSWAVTRWTRYHAFLWKDAVIPYDSDDEMNQTYTFWMIVLKHLKIPDLVWDTLLDRLRSAGRTASFRLFPLIHWYEDLTEDEEGEWSGVNSAVAELEEHRTMIETPVGPFGPYDVKNTALTSEPSSGRFRYPPLHITALSPAEVNAVIEPQPQAHRLDFEEAVRVAPETDLPTLPDPIETDRVRRIYGHKHLTYGDFLDQQVTFETPRFFCDPAYSYRVYGQSVSSCSKLAEILTVMGVTPGASPISVACLAEGIGGMLHWLLCQFPNATGVFNSRKRGSSLQAPSIVLEDPRTRDRVLSPLQAVGIDTLGVPGYPGVFRAEHPGPFSIMTMDAEAISDQAMYRHVLADTLTIFAQCLSPHGLGVIKLLLRHAPAAGGCITMASVIFRRVHLIRCLASRVNTEVYLCVTDPTTPPSYICHALTDPAMRHLEVMQQLLDNVVGSLDELTAQSEDKEAYNWDAWSPVPLRFPPVLQDFSALVNAHFTTTIGGNSVGETCNLLHHEKSIIESAVKRTRPTRAEVSRSVIRWVKFEAFFRGLQELTVVPTPSVIVEPGVRPWMARLKTRTLLQAPAAWAQSMVSEDEPWHDLVEARVAEDSPDVRDVQFSHRWVGAVIVGFQLAQTAATLRLLER